MSLRLTTPTTLTPTNHHQTIISPRTLHPIFSKSPKYPSLHWSSGMRTRAAVERRRGMSFYELLGVQEETGYEGIKRAYKQLARRYHPDVSPPDRAEEYTRRFIEVHEAYETLSDPCRRASYDRGLQHLAFSARRRFDEDMGEKSHWKHRWQYQVEELKKKIKREEERVENLSWGARMRRQRAGSS